MKIVIGYKIGILRSLVEIPELMRCIFEYLDCESLITLSMANKQYFGLHEPSINSEQEEKQEENNSESSSSININNNTSLLLDVNLWQYLLHFYEQSNRKLIHFEFVFNFDEPFVGAKERAFAAFSKKVWAGIYKARMKIPLVFKEDLSERYKIIKEIIEKLKKEYRVFKVASTQMTYGFDIDKNGRASCRYKHCKNDDRIAQQGVRGTRMAIDSTTWSGIYHVECFIEKLHKKHIPFFGLDIDTRINKKMLREILWRAKNARYHVYTCDACNNLLNQKKIHSITDTQTNTISHYCDVCLPQSTKSQKRNLLELPIVLKCSLCKYPCKEVLFSCKCCEDTFICRKCIQGFEWGKHKLHELEIVGKSEPTDLECIEYLKEREETPDELIMEELEENTRVETIRQDFREKKLTRKIPSKKKRKISHNTLETPSDECENTDEIQESSNRQSSSKDDDNTTSMNEQEDNDDSMSDQDDDVYQVEKILQCKTIRKKKHYLIKWKGYPESENTWEPTENISPDLIKAFNKESRASKTNSSKRKR